ITAIREADASGSPEAPADPGWTPLLTTPPFPAYTPGHSTFSGAAAAVLAELFGTDRVRFEATSEGLPGVRRRVASFSAAPAGGGRRGIWGATHGRFATRGGLASGRAGGEHISRTSLPPRGWGRRGRGLLRPRSPAGHFPSSAGPPPTALLPQPPVTRYLP